MTQNGLPGRGWRYQGVELCGRSVALLDATFQLAFAEHMQQLDADPRALNRRKGVEPQHRPRDSLHTAMILFHNIIQILYLADRDGGPMLRVCSSGSPRRWPHCRRS
jgi:hypothetical protein